jgi:hypothetical protein
MQIKYAQTGQRSESKPGNYSQFYEVVGVLRLNLRFYLHFCNQAQRYATFSQSDHFLPAKTGKSSGFTAPLKMYIKVLIKPQSSAYKNS